MKLTEIVKSLAGKLTGSAGGDAKTTGRGPGKAAKASAGKASAAKTAAAAADGKAQPAKRAEVKRARKAAGTTRKRG